MATTTDNHENLPQRDSSVTNRRLVCGIFTLIFSLVQAPAAALELKTAAQQSAPKYFIRADNSVGGLCVEIMQAMEMVEPGLKFSGYDAYLPFKRLQYQLEKGELDVFFGLKKTEARASKFLFLERPLYQVNYVIAVRKDDSINIESLDDLRDLGFDGALATVNGTAASRFLKSHDGLLVRDGVSSPSRLLRILLSGHIRLVFYHDLGLRNIIRDQGLDEQIKILPVSFSTYHHYVAFNWNTPAATIDRVDSALRKISNNGRLGEIQRKYNLLVE